jgi:hypothetical protein
MLQLQTFTAEGIELHLFKKDIENLEHLDFAGFAPNLRGPYTQCMCVLGQFANMQDFQQQKKVMLL